MDDLGVKKLMFGNTHICPRKSRDIHNKCMEPLGHGCLRLEGLPTTVVLSTKIAWEQLLMFLLGLGGVTSQREVFGVYPYKWPKIHR